MIAAGLRSRSAVAVFYGTKIVLVVGLVILGRAGYRIREVPATINVRLSGKSSINFVRSVIYPFNGLLSLIPVLLNREFVRARAPR